MTITILQAYTSCFYKTSRSRFFLHGWPDSLLICHVVVFSDKNQSRRRQYSTGELWRWTEWWAALDLHKR